MKTWTLWVRLWNLNDKEDSTFFGPQQGHSKPWTLGCGQGLLLFPSLVSKSSFNRKEWSSHVFTTAGLGQLNFFSSTMGMVCPGIKIIQYFLKQTWKEKLPCIFFINQLRILLESALVVCCPSRLLPAASCRACHVRDTHMTPQGYDLQSHDNHREPLPAHHPNRVRRGADDTPRQDWLCHSFLQVSTPSMECPPPLLSTQKFNSPRIPARVPGAKGWERKRSEDTRQCEKYLQYLTGEPSALRPSKPFCLSQNWHFGNTRQCWLFVASVQIHTYNDTSQVLLRK